MLQSDAGGPAQSYGQDRCLKAALEICLSQYVVCRRREKGREARAAERSEAVSGCK